MKWMPSDELREADEDVSNDELMKFTIILCASLNKFGLSSMLVTEAAETIANLSGVDLRLFDAPNITLFGFTDPKK